MPHARHKVIWTVTQLSQMMFVVSSANRHTVVNNYLVKSTLLLFISRRYFLLPVRYICGGIMSGRAFCRPFILATSPHRHFETADDLRRYSRARHPYLTGRALFVGTCDPSTCSLTTAVQFSWVHETAAWRRRQRWRSRRRGTAGRRRTAASRCRARQSTRRPALPRQNCTTRGTSSTTTTTSSSGQVLFRLTTSGHSNLIRGRIAAHSYSPGGAN